MKFLYFILGGLFYGVLDVLYSLFLDDEVEELSAEYMTKVAIRAVLAIVAFFVAEVFLKSRK